jgi:hypothetical protein
LFLTSFFSPSKHNTLNVELFDGLSDTRDLEQPAILQPEWQTLMTVIYREIGRRIVQFEQEGQVRAGYGERLIEQLAIELSKQFGRCFGRANLWQMRAFYQGWTKHNPRSLYFPMKSGKLHPPFRPSPPISRCRDKNER